MRSPQIFAHRGASADRRENTLEAYGEAAAQGADWVELDVHLLVDGTLAVYHDNSLAGTDGQPRLLVEMSASDMPQWMPTLGSALAACEGLGVNVEMKAEGPAAEREHVAKFVEAVVAALAPLPVGVRPAGQEIIVSSFNFDVLEAIHPKLAEAGLEEVSTAALGVGFADMREFIARAVAMGCSHLHPWHPQTTRAVVEEAHAVGLGVNVWTANDPDLIRDLADMGVDGIITDRPAAARAALV